MKREGTLYLPASVTFTDHDWHYFMHWFKKSEELGYFYYPYVLISPFVTGMDTDRKKDFPEVEYVVADSGGYQISAQVKKSGAGVGVRKILRWQEGVADVGFTVDYPAYSYVGETTDLTFPTKQKSLQYYHGDYFERCMKISNENAWTMLEAKENKDMELWGVVQGGNYKDLKKWYNHLTNNHEFPGYSVPIASTINPRRNEDWLSQLQFIKEIGGNFHLLGSCEPLLVTVLAKMSQKLDTFYTYDTSTAATGLMLGKYHEPYFMRALSFSRKKPETQPTFDKNKHPPCDCPVCRKHTFGEMIDNRDYTLLLHNVYVRKRFNDYANIMVQDDDVFKELVTNIIKQKSMYKRQKDDIKAKINALIFEDKCYGGIEDFF